MQQWWFVVESQERKKSDLKQLEKTLANATHGKAQLKQLCAQEFACQADAIAALQQFEKHLSWHHLEAMGVEQKLHDEKPGKPKRGTEPSRMTYHPQASLELNPTVVTWHQRRAGRFILTANVLESEQLSQQQTLEEYKGHLLVYNLGQRQLRQALKQANQTLSNQLGKETQSPTLHWIFQCFMAVHYVVLGGLKQIVNLTDERRRILQFFGSTCRQYYLLS